MIGIDEHVSLLPPEKEKKKERRKNQQRWRHGDALCSLPEGVQEPLIIHWTAMHPVLLPR